MVLDKLYIDEAVRIRKTYLTNLAAIVEKEDEIQVYFGQIEDIRKQVEDSEPTNPDEFFVNRLLDINNNIEKIKNVIMPHYDKIQKLDESQRLLYNNIKDKYPNITDLEIQEQIVPHIIPVDQAFTKKNKELYDKVMEKQNKF
jgi:hypothetical protein